MPQLVKGGKNAFGWSIVNDRGEIIIPPDAWIEYGLVQNEIAILMTASQTSGGFVLSRYEIFKNSPISRVLQTYPEINERTIPEGEFIKFNQRYYCWRQVGNQKVTVPFATLEKFGIIKGSHLLSIRGSHIGLSFIVKGPIIEEARQHPELMVLI
jgi:hypothetical protein